MESLVLPEDVIHHIQSFMTGEEAARSAILSKSWHSAWLTRPTVDLDDRGFDHSVLAFQRFAMKTMQRYQDLSLKIKRFRFSSHRKYYKCEDISDELIAFALKLGATDVELELQWPPHKSLYMLKQRLLLDCVDVDNTFFTDFASRFLCLKELTILYCCGWTRIHIASNSLETITFKPYRQSYNATFDVPNIRKFIYSGFGLPSLSINGASREWDFDITIACDRLYNNSWFLNLKSLLTKCKLSRIISLFINLDDAQRLISKHEFVCEVESKPFVVENFRIDAPTSNFITLLLRLLGICRPKFITHYWLVDKCNGWGSKNESHDILCKRLMLKLLTRSCRNPNGCVFGMFGLKKMNMEVYEMLGTEWRPLPLEEPLDAFKATGEKQMSRFEMMWD